MMTLEELQNKMIEQLKTRPWLMPQDYHVADAVVWLSAQIQHANRLGYLRGYKSAAANLKFEQKQRSKREAKKLHKQKIRSFYNL